MPNQNSHITNKIDNLITDIENLLLEGYSVSEVSKRLLLPYAAVYNGVKRHKLSHLVSVKNNGKSRSYKDYVQRTQKFDKNTLESEYIDGKLNLYEIAEKYGVSPSGVLLYMRKLNIKTRNKSEASILMYEKNPEIREKLRQLAFDGITGIHNKNFNRRETWIELAFEDFCLRNSIKYHKQYQIFNKGHRYDFLIGTNILVELDGNFWHNTEKQKKLDENYNILAQDNGYAILRFTDQEIRKTKGKCFDRLIPLVR